MSDNWTTQLEELVTVLCQRAANDSGTTLPEGRMLPITAGTDCMAVLAGFVDGVLALVTRINIYDARIPRSELVDEEGYLDTTFQGALEGDLDPTSHELLMLGGYYTDDKIKTNDVLSIDVKAWLAGLPSTDVGPWVRRPTSNILNAFTPAVRDGVFGTDQGMPGVRGVIASWQKAIVAAAYSVGTFATGNMDAAALRNFWGECYALATGLDVMEEFSPATLRDRLKGGLGAAVAATEGTLKDAVELAGKAVGEAGNLAGQAGGAFASGFLSQASLLTLAVGGFVVYKYAL